jgi:hypothetical protein
VKLCIGKCFLRHEKSASPEAAENIKTFVAGTPINTLSPAIAPERADTPAAVEP